MAMCSSTTGPMICASGKLARTRLNRALSLNKYLHRAKAGSRIQKQVVSYSRTFKHKRMTWLL